MTPRRLPMALMPALSQQMRQRRFKHFRALLDRVPRPLRILDVGGAEAFWRQVDALDLRGVSITLLNREPLPVTHPAFTAVVGDARDLRDLAAGAFDVVFSNSVIEHVGDFADQGRMAREVQRVGRRYYVQTPNRYFPIEPHFFLPYFQFYPLSLRSWIFRHLSLSLGGGTLGWQRVASRAAADRLAGSIRLLSARELRRLFPGGHIWRERVAGLTKSLVVYGDWE